MAWPHYDSPLTPWVSGIPRIASSGTPSDLPFLFTNNVTYFFPARPGVSNVLVVRVFTSLPPPRSTRLTFAMTLFSRLLLLLTAVFFTLSSRINAESLPASPERVHLTLVSSTDLHGHIYPIDYATQKPTADGFAKLATLIRKVRTEAGGEIVLVDCGDVIQGTPLAYYHNRINNIPPDPMMVVMNALGYDALALGNHEFNFGLKVLRKAESEARFPWLSANTLTVSDNQPAFPSSTIKVIKGVKVGILGLTTPGIPNWENTENYAGLHFADPVAIARRGVAELRSKDKVDVVVVAMHMGLEENLSTGVPTPGQVTNENAALKVVRGVPGIDVLFMGHTHRTVPGVTVSGALLSQAGRWGDHLTRTDVYLERATAGHSWQIVAKTSAALPVTADVTPDPEVLTLAKPYHDQTQAWLSQPVGSSSKALSAAESRLRDTAIMDLIQRVQMDSGKADVSFAASFNLEASLPKGPVTLREISGLYIYDNTLVVVELNGAQIREALEHSAKYFRPYEAGKSPSELIDPTVPGYNFDLAEGVDYTIDLTRPQGQRIVQLDYQGTALAPDRKLRVAINNYRLNGGGGYNMFQGAKVLERSNVEIRDLIIDWIRAHPEVPTEPNNNWRLRTSTLP